MSIEIPTPQDLTDLTQHRAPASVTIYIAAAHTGADVVAHGTEAARLQLRSSFSEALAQLATEGLSAADRSALIARVDDLESSREFWRTGARSIAVYVWPSGLRTFRLMNNLAAGWSAGERFDVGPVVRSVTFEHTGYVLALTEGEVRLIRLDSDATSHRVELPALPEDARDALVHTTTEGRFDRQRAAGTLGPKPGRKRYASLVQDAVLDAIEETASPLVLAASADLEHAYREINTHPLLLPDGIGANPSSLSDADLEARTRTILDAYYAARIRAWRETFGTRRANGRGSSDLSVISRAAAMGQVADLLFDIDADPQGTIAEDGAVTLTSQPGPSTYGVIDAVVAQVLRTGGAVHGVRAAEMPDDSPIAALLRS